MTLSMHAACVPVLLNTLTNMKAWLDRDDVKAREAELLEARLAPDMYPLPKQYQIASDLAKNGMARLAGIEPPAMPDTEASLAELKARCDKTIDFVKSISEAQLADSAGRDIVLKFPNGMGFQFEGADYLREFMLPNVLFHASMAYAILRAQGIAIGKSDFLAHCGARMLAPAEPA